MQKLYLATFLLLASLTPALADWFAQVTLTDQSGVSENLQYRKGGNIVLFPTEDDCWKAMEKDEQMLKANEQLKKYAESIGGLMVEFSCLEYTGQK